MAYAIIKTGGKQYKVAEGDVIRVEKLGAEAGSQATFENTFYADGGDIRTSGTVVAEVLGESKDPKVIAYKYRRRKGYHRTVGHRRQVTELKIKSITA